MLFVKCGSKLFDPRTVTTVEWDDTPGATKSVIVSTPGSLLVFNDEEAVLVWAYFLGLPSQNLMRRNEAEAPEAEAANHSQGEC